jgi:thiamine-monophosphate kinase
MANLGEFEFIDQLLKARARQGQEFFNDACALGIGDDAALIPALPQGEQLAVTTDMLVEGRHYFSEVDPQSLGHKVLAVNLSDLAAMGATPVAFTLAAALRAIDRPWLEKFLDGMLALAERFQCPLIGGDTVRVSGTVSGTVPDTAPQSFSVTAIGRVPIGQALRRDGLQEGDDLWVSGNLGDGAYAVQKRIACRKLNWPEPRLALGLALRGLATAAIDISDGLKPELGHLLKQRLSADVFWESLPLGDELQQALKRGEITQDQARLLAATGGDEYEILFGAPKSKRAEIDSISQELSLPLTRIGCVQTRSGQQLNWKTQQGGEPLSDKDLLGQLAQGGFRHF